MMKHLCHTVAMIICDFKIAKEYTVPGVPGFPELDVL